MQGQLLSRSAQHKGGPGGRHWRGIGIVAAIVLLAAGGAYGLMQVVGDDGSSEAAGDDADQLDTTVIRTPTRSPSRTEAPEVDASSARNGHEAAARSTAPSSTAERRVSSSSEAEAPRRDTPRREPAESTGRAAASDPPSSETASSETAQPQGQDEPMIDDGDPSEEVAVLMAEAEQAASRGQPVEARQLLAKAMEAEPSAGQQRQIANRMIALSKRTILGPKVVEGDPLTETYTVVGGDYLSRIGGRFNIPYGLIMRLNGLSSDRIRAGQKLKVVRGPFHARISKSRHELELVLHGVVVKRFPVATGSEERTPAGEYVVREKLTDPTFYPPESMPDGKVVAGGDPDNPLGTRWVAFGPKDLHLGIHGTNEPDSIGKSVSLGCIRMLNPHAEEVYDFLVPELSRVEIRE